MLRPKDATRDRTASVIGGIAAAVIITCALALAVAGTWWLIRLMLGVAP